ncbi:MAG: hypothetical protein J6R47_04160 [Acholeplasmatales bacterium]|nr:hypothetical protein [Acholeplasmatales bacterium]
MTKETAIKASEILDRLADAAGAIEDLHSRDSFYNLPQDIFKQLEEVLLKYEDSIKIELENL